VKEGILLNENIHLQILQIENKIKRLEFQREFYLKLIEGQKKEEKE